MFKSFLLSVFLLLSCLTYAQKLPEKIEFDHIPISGTLTSTPVEDIIQDSVGMIWIAKNTLHRYDGKKFKNYSLIYPDSLPLYGREITKLFWDSHKNRLLIGTKNHGLLQFRYEDNKILKVPTSSAGVPIISNIAQTPDGRVWVSSFSSGLFSLERDTLMRRFTLQLINNPTALVVNGDDLWVGASHNIYVIKKGSIRKIISLENLSPEWRGVVRASSLCFTKEGVWVGTERHGLLRFDPLTLKRSHYLSPLITPFFSTITRIQKDREGLIWILTKNNGLAIYNTRVSKYLHLANDPSNPSSLSGDLCTSILVDKSGIVWIGSSGAVNKYDRNQIKFELFKHEPSNVNSLSDDNIRGLYEGSDGIIWVATADGYINLLNRKTETAEHIKVEVAGYPRFITPLYFCEYDNTMLIGSSHGILQFDQHTKKFGFYKPLENMTKGRNSRQIVKDGNSLFYICQRKLFTYHAATDSLRKISSDTTMPGVSCITVDPDHYLWAGNLGGVTRYHPATNTLQKIRIDRDKFRPDSSFFLVLSIEPKKNEVWVNTFNTGIFVLTADSAGTYSVKNRITTKEGLPDNTTYASMADQHDNEWISTNNGLAYYDSNKNNIITFNIEEGIQDPEFNRLAYLRCRNGELLFGGINGLNIFHPDSLKQNIYEPKPQIIGVGTTANFSSEESFEKYFTFLNTSAPLQLNHAERNLKFDFFIADYSEPSRANIYYRLDPLDPGWSKSENQNAALYANLKPGHYTFSVKATNSDNKELTSSVSFVINPPFWSTWWFISVSILGFCFLVFLLIKGRVAAIASEQLRLERLLTERTSEIEKSREELENLNRKKDLIFSILSHDLRSPLTTLKGFLGMIIDNTDSISKEDLHKYAISIRNSVTNSLDLIDNTLYWSLSQTDTIQYEPVPVDLTLLFEKIKGLYQLTADKKHIRLNVNPSSGMAVFGDENMIYVLLRNLVSNAIKFTPDGKAIYIETIKNSHWIEIKIKDEGIGMSEQEISKIFTLDNPQVKRGTSSERGTGLGLLLCKKFIEVNGGKLRIYSKVGQGSEFIVCLPVHNS